MSDALDLPPPYSFVRLRESGDAFAHACAIAAETGAGTLVRVGRFDLLEFAVVLEPEEPLLSARRAFFAGMNATADALGAHSPPEKPVVFDWPDTIRYDGARVGGGRLGWPEHCSEQEVPDWLVFSATLVAARRGDPGLNPEATSLDEEAVVELDAILESFARNLMWSFDLWHSNGFAALAELYLGRVPKERAADTRRIDENGDLVVSNPALSAPLRLPLAAALRRPSWLDPATRSVLLGR
ncbi:MAG TPA: biotin/lipoate--protein ligase family protein [Enterovirga sp.]|nr:biotin/lipoate--protein ligase family protein [Enterovirga sp.]